MDLASMQDAFDRVTKKQKLSYAKTEDVIDKFMHEIQAAASKLDQGDVVDHSAVLSELQAKLTAAVNQLSSAQKEVNLALSKYGKVMDKQFCADLSKAYRDMDFDHRLVNQIIALHFYRQGMFELGDCFVGEAQESEGAAALKLPFFEMYQILEHMRNKNLEPAIEWAKSHHKELKEKGSSLEFKLHQLEFVQTLLKAGRWEALLYGRRIFGKFPDHLGVIKKLMACMVYFARDVGSNPYKELLAPSHWESVALEFTRECCGLLGQGYESPLHVTLSAGSQALPTLLKLSSVMSNKKGEWQAMKQLPVEIELDKEFQFHSIFACPVSRDQSSAENPPMLLPCGHVLCKQSIVKLAKGNTRPFKCPYCPMEASSSHCRQIHF
ncbi:hypothetical protein SELMODRAFT_79692 [Selaginella moellendorffii]|uniref:RING-Gid-type domain-containing protein n=1 Tax=Selaginella moellendorffii TaxID=88036 RepID=D8QYD4_SELML|nr:protein RMD5 homolog [Selaginella moellendorffii]XP_002974804.1 protein RMD5 homolog [Selaginella moellendorffii]EFJ24324.1 hypothetical protein SELMODRAFT_101739 [Selaginella moellendorffii]EFJ35591.1 hypothetical protein SELMODRAFT_79692 [Selaginella moellendorffii]|eukprot:XP_002963720.1 protein RMD5 homolog [Selaginella moellendorffii]